MFDITKIMHVIRMYITGKDLLIIFGLVILFFLTRLINLDQFPIFTDEGIYIHWSKIAWKDAYWRFISLTDGRQPLQTWGTIPFLKLFESNALLAGRLFSVSTGFFALCGFFVSAYYLFGKKAAYITGLLYVFTPYFLFFDRIALVDSAINAFTIWMFTISIVLARKLRLDVAIILGILSGFAMLGKSSVRLYVGLMLFAVIFVIFSSAFKKKKQKVVGALNYFILYGLTVAIAFVIYNVQRLSPFFHFVSEKNKTFILTLTEIAADPLAHFRYNIRDIPYYITAETGYVIGILGIVGLFVLYKKHRLIAIYLTIWLVVAWLGISLFARVLFPRYVLSLGGLLLLSAGHFLSTINDARRKVILWSLIVVSIVFFDYTILFKHEDIPFPEIDRGQYIEGWPAGWGIKEIIEFSRVKSIDKPVILLAEGNFGMAGDVLDSHLKPGDKITIKGYWPLNENSLEENKEVMKDNHVYVVFSHRKDVPSEWQLARIEEYKKPCKTKSIIPFDKWFGNDPALKSCNEAIYLYEMTDSSGGSSQ